VLLVLASLLPVRAAGPVGAVKLLQASPSADCVSRRLGQVEVTLGSKEPNARTGMAPPSVSYRKAFAQLLEAARARGADAVVLREHESAYVARGARQPRRPTYLSLHGAALQLGGEPGKCPLVVLDPREYERQALARQREDVSTDTGLAF
jgi:hypothetical protein